MSKETDIHFNNRDVIRKQVAEQLAKQLLGANPEATVDEYDFVEGVMKSLSDQKIPVQDKIGGLRNLIVLLLLPQIQPLTDKDEWDIIKSKKANEARQIIYILRDLMKSIYEEQEYTQKEEIDFTHPKIQKAFEFIVEGVLEVLKEMGIPQEQLIEFASRFSTSMVGFESKIDIRFKGISSKALDKVENPLLKIYKNSKEKAENEAYKKENKDNDGFEVISEKV